MSVILSFRGPRVGFLKRPCRTSYQLSVETIALNCLVFEKIVFYERILAADRQTVHWTVLGA